MAKPRTPWGPTDRALAELYGLISATHRLEQTKTELSFLLPQVRNVDHRHFLEDTLAEIERLQDSPPDLARVKEKLVAWQDREFPVQGKRR